MLADEETEPARRGVMRMASTKYLLSGSCLGLWVLCAGCAKTSTSAGDPGGSANGGGDGGPPVACAAPTFLRGINLGNRLDAPHEGDWGPVLHATDFSYIARRGFDHIRLPVYFSGHAADAPPYTIDETFFQRVDWAIDNAVTQCLSILVDIHHYDALTQAPSAESEKFLAMWSQIAARYQGYPLNLAFEVLNEPSDQLTADVWNPLLARAIELIRTTNPERDIFVDGPNFAATVSIDQLSLPADPHVHASVHVYEPSLFTFQGQTWMPAEWGTTGVVFPGPPATPIVPVPAVQNTPWAASWFAGYNSAPAETNPSGVTTIETQFAAIKSYVARTGHSVYNGEWAAEDGGDLESRLRWMRMVREQSEMNGVGWCVWDNAGAGMKLLDPIAGTWDETLLGALFD